MLSYNAYAPLVSDQHDDHVRTGMLTSVFQPCC